MTNRNTPGASASRFEAFVDLGPADRALLASFAEASVSLHSGRVLRNQGDPVDCIYLLEEGWAVDSYDLEDGNRQIVKVHLPGDILGAPSLALEAAGETLTAVTPVVVRPIPLMALSQIFARAPRLAAAFFLCAQQERIFLLERLATVGKRRALPRLAAFLLHIHERLAASNSGYTSFASLPLTQTDIGEILGLTAVHVNRTFRELDATGMIRRGQGWIEFVDVPALRVLSGMPEHRWVRNPAWILSLSEGSSR